MIKLCSNDLLKCALFYKLFFQDPTYKYDKSTGTQISSCPRLCDPYEQHFVEIGPSLIPDAGQGLFAKSRIDRNTVVAFYNGVRTKEEGYEDDEKDNWETIKDEEHRYRLNLSYNEELDVPRDMANVENYCATLGHKVPQYLIYKLVG